MATLDKERVTLATRVGSNREGIWVERTSQEGGLLEVVVRRPLPMQLIKRYVAAGVRRTTVRLHPDQGWYAEIADFPGVWAKEASVKEALDVLEEVASEWVLLKLQDQDQDLPVLDGIDLNHL